MSKEITPEQAALQCDAVAHMAEALAKVRRDRAKMLREGILTELADLTGQETAFQMELLGNILNDMDACDPDEDDWMAPVFREAQRLYPHARGVE